MEKKKDFRGIVLYNIELDGNLNGVYLNNHELPQRTIYTETARLKKGYDREPDYREDGTFEFDCFYFDFEEQRVNAVLVFEIENRLIKATWTTVGATRPIFIGEGYQMNESQIAISYWFY